MFANFLSSLAKILVWLRYKLTIVGVEDIELQGENGDHRPILFLSSHPCFADPIIAMSVLWHRHKPRPLASSTQTTRPGLKQVMGAYDPVEIPNIWVQGRQHVQATRDAIHHIGTSLQEGRNTLVYPAGRFPRKGGYEDLGARSSVSSIIQYRPDTRIVLIRYVGLWGSRTGREPWGDVPPLGKVFLMGLAALLVNLIIFSPRRPVKMVLQEVGDFPKEGSRIEVNHYLESFYNAEYQPLIKNPLFFWQKTKILENMDPPMPVGQEKLENPPIYSFQKEKA